MFEKCIKCNRLGESCVPNLMLLPFSELLQWWDKRQKHLGWTNKTLEEKSKVPLGTISRIKGGDYMDCKYSTMRSILIALIGGTSDEFSCTEQVEKELQQMEQLEKQAARLADVEKENEMLKKRLQNIDELHRQDIRIIKQEFQEQKQEYKDTIAFLREELKERRISNQTK
jgi:vacuolar-type H+-ATPase subunit I/STV1